MVTEPAKNENKCFAKPSGPAGLEEFSSSEAGDGGPTAGCSGEADGLDFPQ